MINLPVELIIIICEKYLSNKALVRLCHTNRRYNSIVCNTYIYQTIDLLIHTYCHDWNNDSLRVVCRAGRLDLARWLVKRFNVNCDNILRSVCNSGNLMLALWLV